jgi:DNA mismatch repair protein MutS
VACARATPRDWARCATRSAAAGARRRADWIADEPGATARAALAGVPELEELLAQGARRPSRRRSSREGGVIRPGYDAHRDSLDDLAHSGKRWVAELERTERARTGISSLKVGFNRVFGYYLEVTRPHLSKVPAEYQRRQTLTTAERFVTPELKARESEILGAEEKLKAREHELFVEHARARGGVRGCAPERAPTRSRCSTARPRSPRAAARGGWTRPSIEDNDRLRARRGRAHPVAGAPA